MIFKMDDDWFKENTEQHRKDLQDRLAKGEQLDHAERQWLAVDGEPKRGDLSSEAYADVVNAYWLAHDIDLVTQNERDEIMALYETAKASLLVSHPELAFFLDSLSVHVSFMRATISTDNRKTIHINPHFVRTLLPQELKHGLGFVAWSRMADTIARRPKDADQRKWDLACNFLANRYLIDEHVGRLPPKAMFINQFDQHHMSIEQLYAILEPMDEEDILMLAHPSFGSL